MVTITFCHNNGHFVSEMLSKVIGLSGHNPFYPTSGIQCWGTITNLIFPVIHELIVSVLNANVLIYFQKCKKMQEYLEVY